MSHKKRTGFVASLADSLGFSISLVERKANWRQRNDYPDPTNKTSMEVWAWEFLRRNPEFRNDCRHIQSLIDACPDEPAGEFADWFNSPYGAAVQELGGAIRDLSPKYGLVRMPPIDNMVLSTQTWSEIYRPFLPLLSPELEIPHFILWHAPKDDNEIAIRFNLTIPLSTQFAAARKLLDERQRELQKSIGLTPAQRRNKVKQARLYQTYLRVLDAKVAKIPTTEIAIVLFPNKKNVHPDYAAVRSVKDALKAAIALRDGGFRALAIREN